jgi:glycosyltransferase involved in cell wall biosynthesis
VVVSDVGPYKIVNEKTGIRVKTGGEWVSALEDLIKNEEKRRKMGEEGYKFWKENCLIEDHWQELKEIVEEIYYDKR